MRFYTTQHPFYCGIDLHARTMYLCIVNQDGEVLIHRNMPAGPEPFLKAVAPYRDGLVVGVECIFTWYWLADLYVKTRNSVRYADVSPELGRSGAGEPDAELDKPGMSLTMVLCKDGDTAS